MIKQEDELGEDAARPGQTHKVIIEFDAEDVRKIENGLVLRIIGLGCCDVGLDAVDFLV